MEDDYLGGDPNSRLAYFSKDLSGTEEEDVFIDNFVWERKKSNQNLIDTGQGKGFSFYLIRHVFDDEDNCDVYNEENPENIKSLGIVYEKVIVVINYVYEDGKIRIISAWEDGDTVLSDIYWRNKEKKNKRRKQKESVTHRKQHTRFISEADKDEVFNFVNKRRLVSCNIHLM